MLQLKAYADAPRRHAPQDDRAAHQFDDAGTFAVVARSRGASCPSDKTSLPVARKNA
jgi:hypothetical protein